MKLRTHFVIRIMLYALCLLPVLLTGCGQAEAETADPAADASRCAEMIAVQDYEAVTAFYAERIAEGSPVNSEMKHWVGTAYMGLGNYPDAVRLFRAVLAEDPEHYYTPYYLGLCEYTQEHYAEAEEAFTAAIGQKTEEARCYYYRGMARLELSRKDEAILDFAMTLALDEDAEITEKAVHMLDLLEKDLG